MIDPELRRYLEEFETKLEQLVTGPSIGRKLVLGIFYSIGYVLGFILVILLLSYILGLIGIIPGFSALSSQLQHIVKTNYQ